MEPTQTSTTPKFANLNSIYLNPTHPPQHWTGRLRPYASMGMADVLLSAAGLIPASVSTPDNLDPRCTFRRFPPKTIETRTLPAADSDPHEGTEGSAARHRGANAWPRAPNSTVEGSKSPSDSRCQPKKKRTWPTATISKEKRK